MRRLIFVVMLAGTVLGGGTALADTAENDHNCAGWFSSLVTPDFVSGGDFGQDVSDSARAGTRDTDIRKLTTIYANCGASGN